jgi:hypothetical protein
MTERTCDAVPKQASNVKQNEEKWCQDIYYFNKDI